MLANELPTEFGSVIGWAKFYKGRVHYYTAVLSQGTSTQGSLWFISGEDSVYDSDELIKEFGDDFVKVGFIEVDLESLDRATVLDRELNKD